MEKTRENRKNWAVRVAVIVLALTLITACLLGSTFAKYTSTAEGSSSATVATWSWEINDTTATSSFTFDLFATVKEADTTTAESDVASGKIAPGTGGQFTIKIDNLSDVSGNYAISFAETNAAGINIEYSTDGTTWGDIDSIEVSSTAIAMTSGTATKTVYWRWSFYEDDAQDTADTTIGVAGTATVAVTATATFTQAD